MCSSKHPLSKARKTQVLLSVISWPCALAAVFATRHSPQAWIELIAVSLTLLAMIDYHLTIRRSRFPAPHLYLCSPGIANQEANLIRSSKSLLIAWSPYSCSAYTFPASSFLVLRRSAHGEIAKTTSLPVVFHRSTPTFHVSS